MINSLDYWKFIAGLGLFLFGMIRIEEALKELAGKRFKLFLKKYTTNRFLAILNGVITTVVLQSSSLVLLMVIAFAGAGIITLSSSLGIILGANLGTTVTGWFVSFFGFKLNIEFIIHPILGIGSLGMILTSHRTPFYHIFEFIVALGLLLMGLNFMKIGMSQIAETLDIRLLKNFGLGLYFLFGFFLTSILHSSSAMMTLTLSALSANVLTIMPAVFIMIGSDIGTTMTAILASFHGSQIKKRIGLAHFLFNLITSFVAIIIAAPLLKFININLQILDPIYILVAFHTAFNLLGVLLFLPFIGIFERILNQFFNKDEEKLCTYIYKASSEVPEAALESVRLELNHFLKNIFYFNSQIVGFTNQEKNSNKSLRFFNFILTDENIVKNYERIKKTEGEILEFIIIIQKEKLDESELKILNTYVNVLRNGVQSAKSIKDIKHNLHEFKQSIVDIVEEAMIEIHKSYLPVHKNISLLWNIVDPKTLTEELTGITHENEMSFQHINDWIYKATRSIQKTDQQVATFLNVNREIYTSNRLLLEALSSCKKNS